MNIRSHYTLSFHYYSKKDKRNHIDLFLDIPKREKLLQIQISPEEVRKNTWNGRIGEPHRKKYLKYSGPVSSNRGKVRILKQGFYKTGPWILSENLPINIKITCQKQKNEKS